MGINDRAYAESLLLNNAPVKVKVLYISLIFSLMFVCILKEILFANDFADCTANTTRVPKYLRGGHRRMQVRQSGDI